MTLDPVSPNPQPDKSGRLTLNPVRLKILNLKTLRPYALNDPNKLKPFGSPHRTL